MKIGSADQKELNYKEMNSGTRYIYKDICEDVEPCDICFRTSHSLASARLLTNSSPQSPASQSLNNRGNCTRKSTFSEFHRDL